MKKRSHLFTLALLGLLAVASIAAYGFHAAVYLRVLERSEAPHFEVAELPGSNPVNLKITVEGPGYAENIRSISMRRRGQTINILYHLSLAKLGQRGWQEPYVMAVPDSVNEVRFGRDNVVIWQRAKPGSQD